MAQAHIAPFFERLTDSDQAQKDHHPAGSKAAVITR
jgi:hypothetical protein